MGTSLGKDCIRQHHYLDQLHFCQVLHSHPCGSRQQLLTLNNSPHGLFLPWREDDKEHTDWPLLCVLWRDRTNTWRWKRGPRSIGIIADWFHLPHTESCLCCDGNHHDEIDEETERVCRFVLHECNYDTCVRSNCVPVGSRFVSLVLVLCLGLVLDYWTFLLSDWLSDIQIQGTLEWESKCSTTLQLPESSLATNCRHHHL